MDRRIAAGVSGAGGRHALGWATEHAQRTGARLALIQVCYPGSPLDQPPRDPTPADIELVDPRLGHAFAKTQARLGGHRSILKIRSGEPADCLAHVSVGVRMLVIGRSRTGDVPLTVAMEAPCLVAVVQQGQDSGVGSPR